MFWYILESNYTAKQMLIKRNIKSQCYNTGTREKKRGFVFNIQLKLSQRDPPVSELRSTTATSVTELLFRHQRSGRWVRRNRILKRLHPVHETPHQETILIFFKHRGQNDQIVAPRSSRERRILSKYSRVISAV